MSENLVNVIQNIRKGTTYGLNISGFSGLTDSNLSGLLEKVSKKEELEAFPDFVGGYIQPKELEILLSKNIIDSDGKTKNALSFLPENFLSQINKNIFLNLPDEYLQLITPEQFLTEILGQSKDTNGAVFENADDKQARFALMFEGKGDAKARRWVFFDCTATRPSRENNTQEESLEAGEDTMTITMSPRSTDKAVKAYIEPNETNQDVYDAFFDKVYEKNAVASV